MPPTSPPAQSKCQPPCPHVSGSGLCQANSPHSCIPRCVALRATLTRFRAEHFSTPLHFADKYFSLNAELLPFPSGTGHMIQALKAGEIDVAVGLTEGWVAGLGKADSDDKEHYLLVGTYVETPLCEYSKCTSVARARFVPVSRQGLPALAHMPVPNKTNKLSRPSQAGPSARAQAATTWRPWPTSKAPESASAG